MNYSIITNGTDNVNGLKRIAFTNGYRSLDLCIPKGLSEYEIQQLISEIRKADPSETVALMTRDALGNYMNLPACIVDEMAEMRIGTEFEYDSVKIKRVTANTYNGKMLVKDRKKVRAF